MCNSSYREGWQDAKARHPFAAHAAPFRFCNRQVASGRPALGCSPCARQQQRMRHFTPHPRTAPPGRPVSGRGWLAGSGFVARGRRWRVANPCLPLPKPSAPPPLSPPQVAYILACIAVLDYLHDAWFYWTHRALHWGPLYRHVHYIHHK